MDYNFHTHTFRCHHASGTEKEYIKNAIDAGMTHFGFADHAPFRFPDGFESWYRVPVEETEDYFETLQALRQKCQKKINISIGFEMEYYPAHFEQMLKNVLDAGCEYLILGQHFIYNEHPDGVYIFEEFDNEDYLKEYVSCVLAGMKTGVFSYLAHPDLPNYTGDMTVYEQEMRKICVAARELSMPLEINFLGIRQNRCYPNTLFWKIAGQEQAPVTFGTDSHSPNSIFQPEIIAKAEALVDRYSLHYIGRPKLKMLQEQ